MSNSGSVRIDHRIVESKIGGRPLTYLRFPLGGKLCSLSFWDPVVENFLKKLGEGRLLSL